MQKIHALFLQFDMDFIDATLATVNFDKMEIFPVASLKGTLLALYNKKNIKWSPDGAKTLGILVMTEY